MARNNSLSGKLFQILQLCALFISFSGIAAYLSCSKSRAYTSNEMREIKLSYAFTVVNIPSGAKRVDIWAPLPQSDLRQTVSNLEIRCGYPYSFESEPEYDNSILRVAANGGIPGSLSVSINFTVTRTAYHLLKEKDQSPAMIPPRDRRSEKNRQRFLAADALVPVDGKIAEEAEKVVNDDMPPLEKARAIYDHVAGTVTYDKAGVGWGRGDAVYACDVRRGNCTDFHSLFIGMARASGIPARFVMGVPVPHNIAEGEISGYHCWAEFYIDGMGWVPVDASEASMHPEKWNELFGGLDPNRVQFTVGRDIRIPSMSPSRQLNYFIYPYVRVDGIPHDDVQQHIRFSEIE